MHLRLTRHTYDGLARIAAQFLAKHHPKGSVPVPIEEIIEFEFGIHVVPMPGLHEIYGIDGFSADDLTQIYVDQTVFEKRHNRFRFTLAHELSHAVLHRPVYRDLKFTTVEGWKRVVKGIDEKDYAWLEYQADALAGLILVPPAALASLVRNALEKVRRLDLDLQDPVKNEVARSYVASGLAKDFEVSAPVVEIRMGKDGLWPSPHPGS